MRDKQLPVVEQENESEKIRKALDIVLNAPIPEVEEAKVEDEPEVLSQEWIDKNVIHVRGLGDIFEAEAVENLIVSKKEITEEQVMDWLDKNDFYDHITAETVLERAVDKGELRYYGTKYSVIETPTIPKYVAEFIEVRKGTDAHSLKYILSVAVERGEQEECTKAYEWISSNSETFARAWLDGFTVEEEPSYRVSAGSMAIGFWFLCKDNDGDIAIGTNKDYYEADWDSLKLTEQEIRDFDERYMVFAKPVEELEE